MQNFCLGLSLARWRDHLPFVINSINRGKPEFKSKFNMLMEYFTQPPVIIPQNYNQHYKFKIGERVRLPLTKAERTDLSFKWSLAKGKPTFL